MNVYEAVAEWLARAGIGGQDDVLLGNFISIFIIDINRVN